MFLKTAFVVLILCGYKVVSYAIRKPELGCFPDSFSGHWSRNRVPTCHFFHTVSGFRTTATLWASGIRILVPNRVNEIEPNISTTIEQKKILKVLMVK